MAERPEDLNLPNAVITRIIKEALPDGVNISKEARSAISRAASVFVLYATSCANNFAMKGKRKTLNAGDVLSAMEEMEFQRFVAPLKESLEGGSRKERKRPGKIKTRRQTRRSKIRAERRTMMMTMKGWRRKNQTMRKRWTTELARGQGLGCAQRDVKAVNRPCCVPWSVL
ncbi:DNA polymerase epsilon subunit 3 isoform X1 [Ammospiza caudacuta]|uniref:DNA polymerase epsilon subunit 3 isoform X1 n=1 Tax=Ammospiza caudacuta TaxID=2857398 RepID=UPI002738F9FC|nr:DNA polymerase epsilon subunit 3 isoform X1 [Ammospiza caudacuta]